VTHNTAVKLLCGNNHERKTRFQALVINLCTYPREELKCVMRSETASKQVIYYA